MRIDYVEPRTGKRKKVFPRHTSSVNSVAISCDNRFFVSGADDKTVRVWNLNLGCQEALVAGHMLRIKTVAITYDSNYIVSGSKDKTIRMWNIIEKREETVFQGHTDRVNVVEISNDRKYAVSGSGKLDDNTDYTDHYKSDAGCGYFYRGDNTVRVWNLSNRCQEAVLAGHSMCVSAVAFSYDLRYAISGGYDKIVIVWDFKGKKLKKIFGGLCAYITKI